MRRVGHGAYDLEHGIHREAVRRIDRELGALRGVASHLDQAPQRRGLQCPDEFGGPTAQRDPLRAPRVLQLIRDLQQVADDHLVVGRVLGMRVDGARDRGGFGRRGGGGRCVIARGLCHERRARQAQPQLRRVHAPCAAAVVGTLLLRRRVLLVQKLETLVGEGVQADVLPGAEALRGPEPERLAGSVRLARERPQHVRDFRAADPPMESDGAQVVAVEPASQFR